MTLLISVKFQNIEEIYKCLEQFGVLIDYDKKRDMKLNDKILVGKVVKTFPAYRRNENCYNENDCLVLEMQKAVPVECLSGTPRIFRLLCHGNIISKISHIQVNCFLALKDPKVFSTFFSQEPSFVLESNAPIIWEFSNLESPAKAPPPLSSDCHMSDPEVNDSSFSGDSDSEDISSLDIGDNISHSPKSSEVVEKEVCNTKSHHAGHSEIQKPSRNLTSTPIEHHTNTKHLNAAKNIRDNRKRHTFENGISDNSLSRTNHEKENRIEIISATNRGNVSSSNDECYELCNYTQPNTRQNRMISTCTKTACFSHGSVNCRNFHTNRIVNCRGCDAHQIINYRGYDAHQIVNCKGCDAHQIMNCRGCDARRITSVTYKHLPMHNGGPEPYLILPKDLSSHARHTNSVNDCNCVAHRLGSNESIICSTANHCQCEDQVSAPLDSCQSTSLQDQSDSDHELEENRVLAENLPADRFCGMKKTNKAEVICRKGNCKLRRKDSTSPERDDNLGRNRFPKRDHLKHKLARRNNSVSPERDHLKNKVGKNYSRSPERDHLKNKVGQNYSRSPERDHLKNKVGQNNSRSPERDHLKNKVRKNYSRSPERSHLKHKSGRSNNNSGTSSKQECLKLKSRRHVSKSPARDHHLQKKRKKLYYADPNESISIGISPVRVSESSRPDKKLCKIEKKGPDLSKTATPPILPFNKNGADTVKDDMTKKFRTSSNVEKISEKGTSTSQEQCNSLTSRKSSISEDENLSNNPNELENNSVSDEEVSENNPEENIYGNETVIPCSEEINQLKENDLVKNDNTVKSGNDNTVKSGNDNTVKSGNDNTIKSGNDNTVKSGNDNTVKSGNDNTIKSGNDNTVKSGNDNTVKSVVKETKQRSEISETESNSKVTEEQNENLLDINHTASLEKEKSDMNKQSNNRRGSCNSSDTCTLDLNERNQTDEEAQSSEMTQPYYDAQEDNNEIISSQVSEFRDIIKTLSEQSLSSFKELFSVESDEFRENIILKLRHLKKKAQISTVVIDICPDARIDPLSIVKGTCQLGCRKSFYINTIPHEVVKRAKCKCCRLITHYKCPSCSQNNGGQNLLCLSFCFDLHVLYGPNVLIIAVSGTNAEKFLGCTVRNYLAYSTVSTHIVKILKKVIVDTPPEDWRNVILLKLNVKSIPISKDLTIFKMVNTYLSESLIRRGCFLSIEQL